MKQESDMQRDEMMHERVLFPESVFTFSLSQPQKQEDTSVFTRLAGSTLNDLPHLKKARRFEVGLVYPV